MKHFLKLALNVIRMRLVALAFVSLVLATSCLSASAQTQQSAYGFLSLSGNNEKSHAVLTWETIQELTLTHFNVQQSTNGYDFVTVGTMNASHDTSVTRHQYRFVDANAAGRSKRLYYRLEIGVNNGRKLYSKTFMVRFDDAAEDELNIHPNVVRSVLPLALQTRFEGSVRLQILDPQGRVLRAETIQVQSGSTFRSIDVSGLPQGQYVALVTGDGLRLQQRFFHQ
jgi:hypothetical protein